jgi:hypothetical protein
MDPGQRQQITGQRIALDCETARANDDCLDGSARYLGISSDASSHRLDRLASGRNSVNGSADTHEVYCDVFHASRRVDFQDFETEA